MSAITINGQFIWQLPNGTSYYVGGPNNTCTVDVCPVELSVYGYRPHLAASGVLIALYAICIVLQLALSIRYRTWWYMGCMVTGCAVEILGYVGRILYWQNPWLQPGFLMQIILITIGPVFFAAAIYVLLAQIINYISPTHSRFAPKWYTVGFISVDIISLVLQAIGGAMSSTSNGRNQNGVKIALAGLSFQVITLVAFILLVADYAARSRPAWSTMAFPPRFRVFMAFLAAATLFILIRCSYRIYELAKGYSRSNKALRDEPLFIGLESVMIILAAYALVVAHPGLVFGREKLRVGRGQGEERAHVERALSSDAEK